MINKLFKAGILIATLMLPVVFFVGPHFLGENKFGLPRFGGLSLKTNKVSEGFVFQDSVYHQVVDYSFIDEDSLSFSFNTFNKKIKVVSVFSIHSDTEYAQIISNLTRLSAVYLNQESVGLLTISVEPENDKPSLIKKYKNLFEIDNSNWKFLTTNDKLSLNDFLKNELFIGSNLDYSLINNFFKSQTLVLIDKSNVIRGYYDGTRLEDVDDLIGAIKILQSEYE